MLSLLISLALAQPITTGGVCTGPAKICTARQFRSTSSSATVTQACFQNNTNALVLRRNSQYLEFGVASSCSGGLTAFPLYLDTTSLRTVLGSSVNLVFDGFATASALGTPAVKSIAADVASGRLWRSDAVGWGDVQSGAHDVIDAPVYVVDVGQGGGASEWRYAPRTTGAHTPSTLTETCAGGTQIGLTASGFRGLSRPFRLRQTQALANATCGQQSGPLTIAYRWRGRWSTHAVISAALTNVRIVCGIAEASLFTAPTDAPVIQGYWFRFSTSAGDAAWQLCTGDGAATSCTSTTVAPVLGTSQELRIDSRESAASTAWVDGVARARKTTNLPTGSANLVEGCVARTLGAAVRDVGHTNIVIEGNL